MVRTIESEFVIRPDLANRTNLVEIQAELAFRCYTCEMTAANDSSATPERRGGDRRHGDRRKMDVGPSDGVERRKAQRRQGERRKG
jgi:hypothetical protein